MLNTEDVARQTGLAVSTLEKLRLTGNGPRFVKLGRAVRYRPEDIENWIASRIVSSTSESVAA